MYVLEKKVNFQFNTIREKHELWEFLMFLMFA